MKINRLIIILAVILLSLGLVSFALAAASSEADTSNQATATDIDEDDLTQDSEEEEILEETGEIQLPKRDRNFLYIPPGWTVIDNAGTGMEWNTSDTFGVPNRTTGVGGTGLSMAAEADGSNQDWDTELWTPSFDLSASTAVTVEYASNFQDFAGNGDSYLDISTDGGSNWTNIHAQSTDEPSGGIYRVFDISAYAGNNDVMLRWVYTATSSSSWYWHIDNAWVYDNAGTLIYEEFELPPAPDFSDSYKEAPGLVIFDDPIHYDITITNTGELTAFNAVMTDVIPIGTEYITNSVACSSGSCYYDNVDNAVYWSGVVEVPPGSSMVTVGFDVLPLACDSVIDNQAIVNDPDLDYGQVFLNTSTDVVGGIGFETDFELDDGGFVGNGEWAWGDLVPSTSSPPEAHSGTKLWATNLSGDIPSEPSDHYLTMTLDIPFGGGMLSWWDWWDEDGSDEGYVYIDGVQVYFIDADQLSWENHRVDLTQWAGQTVEVVFYYLAGGSLDGGAGWYIDDVSIILPCQVPNFSFSTKQAPGMSIWADPIHYDVNITNTGVVSAFNAVMTDVIPVGTEFISGSLSCTSGSCSFDSADNAVYWNGIVESPPGMSMVSVGFDVQPLACGLLVDNEAVANDPELTDGPVLLTTTTEIVGGIGFELDFEADDGGFLGNGEWAWGDLIPSSDSPPEAHSGTKLWATNLSGDIPSEPSDHYLTKTLDIPLGGGMLSWWDWWDEDGVDIGFVYVDGVEVYSIDVDQLSWMNHRIDLTPWEGQTVDVVFYYQAGGSGTGGAGWYIDDVSFIIGCAPPDIEVDPQTLNSTQLVNEIITKPMTITNNGDNNLEWLIYEAEWQDNFDSYAPGSQMHGQGGWKGWDNNPAYGALVTTAQAHSAPNSVEILGNSDLVHEYVDYEFGIWTFTAWQYIPSTFSGETYFILLNTYNDGGPYNWSTQVNFNSTTGQVVNDGASGGTLPIVMDQWVEIRVEIDLTNDTQAFYYDNQMLYQGTWTDEVSGNGMLNIGAVDLFANGASEVYYDDISIASTCANPEEIPWLSAIPNSGMTFSGMSTLVDVIFDSTGMTSGEYTGMMCVASNDPVDPVIPVPVTMTLMQPAIEFTKTVGLDPNVCAASDSVDVTTNSEVTYCYEVTNTGSVTLTTHTLVDDFLGLILDGVQYNLIPGESFFVTQTATIIDDVTNTAMWTASLNETISVVATDTASVDVRWPAIELNKTVGLDPNVCSDVDSITVPISTEVTYCYEVTNTGEELLPFHDLVDSELGVILDDFAYDLGVGESVFITQTVTIMTDTVNSATWTAFVDDLILAEDSDSSTVSVIIPEPEGYMIYLPLIMRDDTP